MATPIVRRTSSNQSHRTQKPESSLLPLTYRRIAAWAAEITLVVTSGLVPFGIGVYANSSNINRVPLNPVLVVTERAIARPLALPVSYGIRNVAWPTNFLWTIALLAPLTLSGWQIYELAKTGSTIPKRWFGVKVVNSSGAPPGLKAVLLREVIGRWTVTGSVAYIIWSNSFVFPDLASLSALTSLLMLAEGLGFSGQQGRRALHDRIAGTYTVDANTPFPVQDRVRHGQWTEGMEEEAIASVVMTPSPEPNLWLRMRQQNPSLTLLGVALVSMTAVLATLIGTQIFIHNQQNQRETQQRNSQQFLTLFKQLNPQSGASTQERRNAILAMGTLKDPQATQYLVDLLSLETDPTLLNTIEQALVNVGLDAIPNLKQKNQFITSKVDTNNNEEKQKQLLHNQQAINKILAVYSGKTNDIDLSRVQLSQTGTDANSFNLVLDKADLWGINFKSANLNQASFKGSRFRGPGQDDRPDTYDDWIADLSQAQMKRANLSEANLSRVLMNRTDLSRATLNKANLSYARLIGANLSSAQLTGADLRGAVLENASLTGANLGEAKLNEAELYAARLSRVIAVGTQLSYANLTKTDWQAADLSGSYLDHANLSDANLSATRLTGAILRSANLENANLRNTDLSLADLRGANLTGADFQGAILTPDKQDATDQFVQTPAIGIQSAVIKDVDFSQVKNLDPKQLAYICTQGGIHPRCP